MGRTLAIVGERWTPIILRECFAGVRRFADFRERLGIASNLLSTRLNTLVDAEILERIPYREDGGRERHEYQLTPRGLELRPILLALQQWGDEYMADSAGPSIIVRHKEPCDQEVHVTMECVAGHRQLSAADLYRTPGPGALFDRRKRKRRDN